jgi:hypothetical protein
MQKIIIAFAILALFVQFASCNEVKEDQWISVVDMPNGGVDKWNIPTKGVDCKANKLNGQHFECIPTAKTGIYKTFQIPVGHY